MAPRNRKLDLLLAAAGTATNRKKLWAKDWLQNRKISSSYNLIFQELRSKDPASFVNYMRMSPDLFNRVL